jgi:hypothetical protein
VKAEDVGKALAPWELGSLLLGTCSDVKEAVAAAKSVLVGEVVQKDTGFASPGPRRRDGRQRRHRGSSPHFSCWVGQNLATSGVGLASRKGPRIKPWLPNDRKSD